MADAEPASSLMDLIAGLPKTPTQQTPLCGRPRSTGQPCKSLLPGDAPACHFHLTATERDELDRHRAEQSASGPTAITQPACWSWPHPERPVTSWADVADWHADRCAACGYRRELVTDHCHKSGLVRGLLCRGCNVQEGCGNPWWGDGYRARPPAVILGYTEPYLLTITYGRTSPFAQPEPWLVELLGPLPDDPSEASRYLAAAVPLFERRDIQRPDFDFLRRIGL